MERHKRSHAYTHNLLLHFTCLTFNFHVLLIGLSARRAMIQMKRGRGERREGWMDGGRETDEENSKTLLLSPAFSLSAGSYLPWLCCMETWADIKSDAKMYMRTHTLREAHTQIIFTSCALLPSVDISWLPRKLKAHMQMVIHMLICVCRFTHIAAQTHSKTWKYFADRDTDSCCVWPKKYFSLTHTHEHVMSFRLKMKDIKLKGSAWVYPLSTNLSLPLSLSILTITVTNSEMAMWLLEKKNIMGPLIR